MKLLVIALFIPFLIALEVVNAPLSGGRHDILHALALGIAAAATVVIASLAILAA